MIYTINTLPSLSSTASTADEIILYGTESSATGKLTVQELASTMGLSIPIDITNGGTGATSASEGLSNLGGLSLSGGTLTGNLSIKMSGVTRGTTPTGNNYMRYNIVDNDNTQLGLWEIGVLSNGNAVMNTWLMGHHTSSEQYGGLQITKAVGNTNNAVLSFNANTGLCTASSFSGNGASLTALNASNISSGTLSSGYLPTVPVAKGGTGQTTLAAARNAMGLGNTTGALPIANGGTGATNRLTAFKNITNQDVGNSAQYFVTLTNNWATAGYSSNANVKTALGMKCTQLYSGTFKSGSTTFSAAYEFFIIFGSSGGGARETVVIPKAVLSSSDTKVLISDDESWLAFNLKYSGTTGTMTWVENKVTGGTTLTAGSIMRIYGVLAQ